MFHLLDSCKRDEVTRLVVEHLPAGSSVLESGCGAGRYVKYLSDLGYKTVGLEWSLETVRMVHSTWPELTLVAGDVTRSPFQDHSFDGVLSLGVVEHFVEGPGPALREIVRILKPGGRAIITVPCLNGVRRLKRHLWWYEIWTAPRCVVLRLLRGRPMGLTRLKYRQFAVYPALGRFFEYRLTPAEFAKELERAGFLLLRHVPVAHMDGIYHELNPFRLLVRFRHWRFRPSWLASVLNERLARHPFLHCHMQAAVVQKPFCALD